VARRSYHGSRRRSNRRQADVDPVGVLISVIFMGGIFLYPRLLRMSTWRLGALGALIAFLIIGLIFIAHTRNRQRERERLTRDEAYALTAADFEKRIGLLLKDLGWEHVELVGKSGDDGVDLHAVCQGIRYVVQCKRYKGNVSPDKVRELEAVRQNERAHRGLLVTTGHFGDGSRAWEQKYPLELWDGELLAQKMRAADEAKRDPVLRRREIQQRVLFLSAMVCLSGIIVLWSTFTTL
jgi:Restriction endonuclease